MKKEKNTKEYSKKLLIQESFLIWILTISMIGLAYLSIIMGYIGTLPWLTTMIAFPWTAYGVSQAFYYKKSEKENTKDGIKFESVMADINALYKNANLYTSPSEEESVAIGIDYNEYGE